MKLYKPFMLVVALPMLIALLFGSVAVKVTVTPVKFVGSACC